MPSRRDMLAGLGCAGSLAAAEALRPRRALVLMPQGTPLSAMVPARWDGWEQGGTGDIVIPQTEGSLADRLYGEQLARVYHGTQAVQPGVMLLIAYGKVQNDLLQLHRPESCYPAVGFEIVARRFVELAGGGRRVPAVELTAQSGARVEDIVYWTRIGTSLPRTSAEQSWDHLQQAMRGYVGDGVLVRASAVRDAGTPLFANLRRFMDSLIGALSPAARTGLIGA